MSIADRRAERDASGAAAAARPRWSRAALVAAAAFALGWAAVEAVRAAPAILALHHQANEAKYLVMSGQAGPVTYLVEHDELAALEALARADDSILGAEQYALPSSVAVAFVDADAPGIAAVAALPGTGTMRRRRVPMICH